MAFATAPALSVIPISLRHDALNPHATGRPPDPRAIALDGLGELQPGCSLADHVSEDGLAVLKHTASHILTVEVHGIEGNQHAARGALAGKRGM